MTKNKILELIEKKKYNKAFEMLENAPDEDKDDRKFMGQMLDWSPRTFRYASKRLRNDREFASIAIKASPINFKFTGEELKNNQDFLWEMAEALSNGKPSLIAVRVLDDIFKRAKSFDNEIER